MKNKLRNQKLILNYITSTERYKLIFWVTIIISLYGSVVLGISSDNFIDSIFIPFQFPIFNILMFTLLFLNTLNTCSIFNDKFSFYVLRLGNKKKFLKEIIKNAIILNLFHFLIFFMFYFMVLCIFKLGAISIHDYQNYSISNLIYLIFYLGRYILLSIIICSISTLIFVNFKSKTTMLMNILFLSGFLTTVIEMKIENSFQLLPWSYFQNIFYNSFFTEIKYSLLFILILELILYILYIITLRNKRWVIS